MHSEPPGCVGGPAPSPRPAQAQRAVFVDRDGTINPDLRYLADAARLEVFLGVAEGIRLLRAHGYRVLCTTNQSGIERDYYTHADVGAIHHRVNEILAGGGASIDAFYYCPHAPESACECRKPATGMLEKAALDWNVDFAGSAIVGDRSLDVEAGESIGLLTVVVPPPGHEASVEAELASRNITPDVRASGFLEAALRILTRG
ncbi:MAG: HAD family hydrolase [Thermoplasmata archaeon]|nr:HAD family hydrolase [Thermoplasmata archaeon]